MKAYEITNMIIDDGFQREETVTADFTREDKLYSISFSKADLELINAWVFENHTSFPACL
ncbi:hypothetical protein [Radiobacillus sp. PE A8.2]|uniref:hypothetical protein n=1 Tax=Radiobacillus sp. PE A8.2 TaxID=3380349 RepID=UPI00388FC06A